MTDIYNKKNMKFGILKSQIETKLLESYGKNTFKQEMKNFNNLVLKNKNISKLFYLYDELNSNKGLNESIVDSYIFECVTLFENTLNKITPKQFNEIKFWVGDVKTENLYENIDNLFSTDVLTIESKIKSKKLISEELKKQPKNNKESVNIPISTMVNIANKTIANHIETLEESDKKELLNILSSNDEVLTKKFEDIKESVVLKLTEMKRLSDDISVKSKIDETLSKVISEKYDKLNYVKLKSLNENL